MKAKRRLLTLIPAVWLLLTCSVAFADDGLPRTPLNLDPAHLPAYERFPVWSYTVDGQYTDGAVRQLGHLVNGLDLGRAWLVKLAIRCFEYALTWRLPTAFMDGVGKVTGALRSLIWEGDLAPLTTGAVVLSGLVALYLVIRGRTRAAWASVLRLFAVIVLGTMLMGAAGSWAPSLLSLTADLNTMIFTETARVGAPATAGPKVEQVRKWALTNTGDVAWRYFVHDPWAVQEYGSLEAANRHAKDGVPGAELLTMTPTARTDWYYRQSQAVREQDLSWWTEDALPRRLTLAVTTGIGGLVYSAALFVLAGGLIVQQLLVLLLTMAAPFVFLLALWPGVGQAWLTRWVRGLVQSLVGQTVAALLLGLTVVLTTLVSGLESTLGWEMAAFLLSLLGCGIVVGRRYLSLRWRRRASAPGEARREVRREVVRQPIAQSTPAPLPQHAPLNLEQARQSAGVAAVPSPRSAPGPADALAQEMQIQHKRTLLAESEAGPVKRPAALPGLAREVLAPTYTLIHQAAPAQMEPAAPAAAPATSGAGAPQRDLRERRPASPLAVGRKPLR